MPKKLVFSFLYAFLIFVSSAFGAEKSHSSTSKTVLITGGAGFMGSNFLKFMFDKHPDYHFIVLDALTYAGSIDNIPKNIQNSNRFKFVKGNVVDLALVDRLMSASHFVVHFAAETDVTRSIKDDYVFLETDVIGTRSMLASLIKNAKTVERFIHISTSEVYGTAVTSPMTEEHPLQPRSPYAAAKAGADRLVYAYSCTYDIPTVTIRPFNNYGPQQHPEKLIPRFITAAIQKKPLTIQGTGTQERDWVHTLDLAIAIDKVLHIEDFSKVKNQEINIGTGRPVSVAQIARMILNYFDLPESYLVHLEDRPGQVHSHIASNAKAKRLLGWSPSIEFETGLKMTIEWYLKNPSYWTKKIKE